MGLVYAVTEVTNINGDTRCYSMPFLVTIAGRTLEGCNSVVCELRPEIVNTGATDTVIPSNELEKIGISREGKRTYELADGTIVSYDIGYAFVCVNGEKVAANVVFGGDGCEPLLGVTVLESAGLIVDPVHKILKKTAAIALK